MRISCKLAHGLAASALIGGVAVAPTASASASTMAQAYSSTECSLVTYKNSDLQYSESVPDHNLAYGDYGDYCVKQLQRGINYLYGNVLSVDGNFGPETQKWVRTFQEDPNWGGFCSQGVDGQAGLNTNSCLQNFSGTYTYPV
jgi:Putative peptidoglycan binding domain